jgi:prevent-host-death family protein
VKIVNIHQAKSTLSQLLHQMEQGEEIVIANRGVPVAKLVSFHPPPKNRHDSLGQDRGLFEVPEDFDAPLTEEILTAFEGSEA